MKRIITSLLIGCALLTSVTTKAQSYSPLSFGIKAGLSLPTTNEDNYEMKAGFIGGIVVDYELTRNLFLRSGVDFVMKGAKLDRDLAYYEGVNGSSLYRIKQDTRLNYIQIPIAFGYKNEIGNGFTAYINAGPYFALGVYGKGKSSSRLVSGERPISGGAAVDLKYDSFDDMSIRKFDFGVIGSIGVEYSKYFINVGYEYGLTNSYEKDVDGSWHNMVGTCTLGYKF